MALSSSRHRFVRFVFCQDVATWIDCHVRAFAFFGGVPTSVVLDNLKSGVIKPDIYDPTLNRAYGELERHYGFVADPAAVDLARHAYEEALVQDHEQPEARKKVAQYIAR
jgi:transposase